MLFAGVPLHFIFCPSYGYVFRIYHQTPPMVLAADFSLGLGYFHCAFVLAYPFRLSLRVRVPGVRSTAPLVLTAVFTLV